MAKNLLSRLDKVAKYVPAINAVDNVANLVGTLFRPKTPEARTISHNDLKTDINVNPQINTIKRGSASLNRSVNNMGNNANNQVLNMMSNVQSTNQINDVLGQEQNIETQLYNKNQEAKTKVDMYNSQIRSQRDLQEFNRKNAIIDGVLGNVADAVDDFNVGYESDKAALLDQEKMLAEVVKNGDIMAIDNFIKLNPRLQRMIEENPEVRDTYEQLLINSGRREERPQSLNLNIKKPSIDISKDLESSLNINKNQMYTEPTQLPQFPQSPQPLNLNNDRSKQELVQSLNLDVNQINNKSKIKSRYDKLLKNKNILNLK